jgi:Zn finger protein HypA/HybF involved in hydrogenase expression
MGHEFEAKCRDCEKTFRVSEGGGFSFHLVRCDQCGETKTIDFEDLGELHLQYLKGLSGPYCIASSVHDKDVQEHAPVEPISKSKYHAEVESQAGSCKCGGHYAFDAPPRCPACRSTRMDQIMGIEVNYD